MQVSTMTCLRFRCNISLKMINHQGGIKLAIAVTGASGSFIAAQLMEAVIKYQEQVLCCDLVFSKTALEVARYEHVTFDVSRAPFRTFDFDDFYSPMASGSADYDAMIICPCSVGTMGRIASGISNDLITRAADVFLKEKRRLILVLRETPYNLIHIRNMEQLIQAGAIIYPANPSFYHHPVSIAELYNPMILRILKLVGFKVDLQGWGNDYSSKTML